jgi:hypothetical protein
MSGDDLLEVLAEERRRIELATFKKHRFFEKRSIKQCRDKAGQNPNRVWWADTNKGDVEKPEHRCRLVSQGGKFDKRKDLFAATPTLSAKNIS